MAICTVQPPMAGRCTLYDLGCGTVFKISTAGALTTLHYFVGPEGAFPNSGLLLDLDGNFYGTLKAAGHTALHPTVVARFSGSLRAASIQPFTVSVPRLTVRMALSLLLR